MTLRSRLLGLLGRNTDTEDTDDSSTTDSTSPPTWSPTPLAELDVDPPEDASGECPNCGASFDSDRDLQPPRSALDGPVDAGEHARLCHIGTEADSPLAGWKVIHREA